MSLKLSSFSSGIEPGHAIFLCNFWDHLAILYPWGGVRVTGHVLWVIVWCIMTSSSSGDALKFHQQYTYLTSTGLCTAELSQKWAGDWATENLGVTWVRIRARNLW